MARQLTYPEIVGAQMDRLMRLTRNLLVNNPNYKFQSDDKMPYYFETYPKSYELHRKVITDHAEYILQEMENLKTLFVDMAADEEV